MNKLSMRRCSSHDTCVCQPSLTHASLLIRSYLDHLHAWPQTDWKNSLAFSTLHLLMLSIKAPPNLLVKLFSKTPYLSKLIMFYIMLNLLVLTSARPLVMVKLKPFFLCIITLWYHPHLRVDHAHLIAN